MLSRHAKSGERFSLWNCLPMPDMPSPHLLLLILISCLLVSCQTGSNHKITLKDGREFMCKGEPHFVGKTGYYRYRTFQDRDAMLRADEVLMIEDMGI
jgi:hypothetical protein